MVKVLYNTIVVCTVRGIVCWWSLGISCGYDHTGCHTYGCSFFRSVVLLYFNFKLCSSQKVAKFCNVWPLFRICVRNFLRKLEDSEEERLPATALASAREGRVIWVILACHSSVARAVLSSACSLREMSECCEKRYRSRE